MAQYKVPQDVEADDKLIGPFSFRQFVYLMIAGGLIAAAVGLFQLFPALAIIPVPFVFFFLALALPLKKDQPMETYLAAVVAYYLKPHARVWMPGQKENPILITAPKKVEESRTRDITSEEATHRLSFLADIVDTEGYAIKGAGASPMREDLVAEANAMPDMFETYQSQVINRVIDQDKMSRHQSAVTEMRNAIARSNASSAVPDEPEPIGGERVISRNGEMLNMNSSAGAEITQALSEPAMPPVTEVNTALNNDTEKESINSEKVGGLRDFAVLKPDVDVDNSDVLIRPEMAMKKEQKVVVPGMDYLAGRAEMEREAVGGNVTSESEKVPTKPINNSIMELANNTDFSVATIAKEANRINRKEKGEVFISLH